MVIQYAESLAQTLDYVPGLVVVGSGQLAIAASMDDLSPRQFDNIELASHGLSLSEIAANLGISEKTVKNQRAALIAKFAALNMTNLVCLACEADIFDQPLKLGRVGWLSPVLLEELDLAAAGFNRSEAGRSRFVSPKTVANNRARIYDLLDARNMCHAVRIGFQVGYLPRATTPAPELSFGTSVFA